MSEPIGMEVASTQAANILLTLAYITLPYY